MSHTAASTSASTQNTPKPRGSGMPNMPANTYSGDNATPRTTRSRWRPLITACRRAPGFSAWASAKASETQAGMAPSGCVRPGDMEASSAMPLRSTMRFSSRGRRGSMPINWPISGSDRPSMRSLTGRSTVACTRATPGTACSTGSSDNGARRTEAKTSAKRPCS